ncbi:MAG TPA: type I restriction enzyme HsdR N-terminal domain-containing protein [Nitrospirota bacterium]|nr:type I restriction enzyme HsdR N-terminal domain-containing protein [Nitrospirota bacterium]
MEDESVAREKKIIAILNEEIEDGADLAAEARRMVEYLLLEKKGYAREEVRKNVVFDVVLDKERLTSSVDFLVTVEGKKAMIIKCAAGSLASRERQALAAARLIGDPPVPIAVVADPETAEVLDAGTGEVIGEGFGAIPTRDQIAGLLSERRPVTLSPVRIEREKRILLAFDAIRCSVPRGADGGVRIGPEPGKDKC